MPRAALLAVILLASAAASLAYPGVRATSRHVARPRRRSRPRTRPTFATPEGEMFHRLMTEDDR